MKYICQLCGWVYDEEETGVKFEDLSADFACELCGAGKDSFSPAERSDNSYQAIPQRDFAAVCYCIICRYML